MSPSHAYVRRQHVAPTLDALGLDLRYVYQRPGLSLWATEYRVRAVGPELGEGAHMILAACRYDLVSVEPVSCGFEYLIGVPAEQVNEHLVDWSDGKTVFDHLLDEN